MVDRQTRVKKKKFRKTPGSNTVTQYTREKNTKAKCNITGKQLAGTANQSKAIVNKLAKTKRRPSVKFGGVLSSPARKQLWEYKSLIEVGKITPEDIPIKFKKFITGDKE